MLACGAKSAHILPGKEALIAEGIKVIQAQAKYEGGYWNTTGIARPITVRAVLPEMESRGIDVFFHGATGRGNDQMRFERYTNVLAPKMVVYAPWRELPAHLERTHTHTHTHRKERESARTPTHCFGCDIPSPRGY